MSRISASRSDTKRSGSGESDPKEVASVAPQTKAGAVADRQAVTETATNRRGASKKKKPNKTKSALIVGLLKRKSGA